MCGNESEEISISSPEDLTAKEIEERLGLLGWLVEVNGDNFDTYCSGECAK